MSLEQPLTAKLTVSKRNNPQRPKAVLFDLDGVVFDSRRANIVLYNHLLEVVGLPPTAERHVEVIHRESMEGSLKHLMGLGPEYHQALRYWETLDPSRFITELELFPAVKQTLDQLAPDYTLGVITNRLKTTRQALEYFGLWEYFERVTTPLEAGAPKPDERMMSVTLDKLGLTRDQVVYVGDSVIDEALCQNCGVRLVAFRNRGLEAWAHVEHFQEIPPLLNGAQHA